MLSPKHFVKSIMKTALHRKKVVRLVRARPAAEAETCVICRSIRARRTFDF